MIAIGGKVSLCTVNASVVNIARGDLLGTTTAAGRAAKAVGATVGSVFGRALAPATTDGAQIGALIGA
jgi:hypothetical protein